ncbi:MAG: phage major tail tube protein [Velocimicrobium sp.]
MYRIPETVNLFNVYNGNNRQTGVTGAVELPSFEYMTNTVSPAGVAGEYEAPTIGHFGSQKIKIPFAQIDEQEYFKLVKSEEDIILRASIQAKNVETSKVEKVPMNITVRGATTTFEPGSIEKGKAMSASVTKEIAYIKIIINNVVCLELDKFNSVYILDGEDVFKEVRAQI